MSTEKHWPSWRFGPNGQSDVFNSEDDVPKGWVAHPSLLTEKAPAAVVSTTAATDDADLDVAGWPFDPALHAATKTKTSAGLWRMKVGASRPEPKPGFPKLDL